MAPHLVPRYGQDLTDDGFSGLGTRFADLGDEVEAVQRADLLAPRARGRAGDQDLAGVASRHEWPARLRGPRSRWRGVSSR